MEKTIPIYQVDAFTAEAFRGNPAAVCLLEKPRPAAWMQAVAREMSLSETAFLLPEGEGYHLRWFTPTVEVPLCGHATLASAHVLWETGRLDPDATAQFHTLSGLLTARKVGVRIELNFPAKTVQPAEISRRILTALGVSPYLSWQNDQDYLIEVEDEDIVRGLQPDFTVLREIPSHLLIVTAVSKNPRYDFVSRVFVPHSGIDEDPVTGSAHCYLGPYWARKMEKAVFAAYQASERGGELRVRLQEDRVILGGQAVTILRGELLV